MGALGKSHTTHSQAYILAGGALPDSDAGHTYGSRINTGEIQPFGALESALMMPQYRVRHVNGLNLGNLLLGKLQAYGGRGVF